MLLFSSSILKLPLLLLRLWMGIYSWGRFWLLILWMLGRRIRLLFPLLRSSSLLIGRGYSCIRRTKVKVLRSSRRRLKGSSGMRNSRERNLGLRGLIMSILGSKHKFKPNDWIWTLFYSILSFYNKFLHCSSNFYCMSELMMVYYIGCYC